MKRLFSVHRHLRDLITPQRAYKSDVEIDRAILMASRELFNYFNGATGEYQKGLPMARVGYGISTVVNEALHPFLRRITYSVAVDDSLDTPQAPVEGPGAPQSFPTGVIRRGTFTLPAGFVRPVSFEVPTALDNVRVLNVNQKAAAMRSTLDQPTAEYPFVVPVPNGYEVQPTDTPTLTLHYLGIPPEPKYALLLDSNGELALDEEGVPQYDDDSSVDHGWGESQENNLIWIAAKILAGESRDTYMQQFADQQAQKG